MYNKFQINWVFRRSSRDFLHACADNLKVPKDFCHLQIPTWTLYHERKSRCHIVIVVSTIEGIFLSSWRCEWIHPFLWAGWSWSEWQTGAWAWFWTLFCECAFNGRVFLTDVLAQMSDPNDGGSGGVIGQGGGHDSRDGGCGIVSSIVLRSVQSVWRPCHSEPVSRSRSCVVHLRSETMWVLRCQ